MKTFPDPDTNYQPRTFGERFVLHFGIGNEKVSPLWFLLFGLVNILMQFLTSLPLGHEPDYTSMKITTALFSYLAFSTWRNRQFMKMIRALDGSKPRQKKRKSNVQTP